MTDTLALRVGLHDRLDDQFRDMSPWGQARDRDHAGGHIFGLQHRVSALLADRFGPLLEDGRVHFARIDIGDADSVLGLLQSDRRAERGHGELRGAIGDPAQVQGSLSRNR